MEGEASQKDMTGARGTPPASSAHITGITPQEQKGLKAPTMVASNIETTGRPLNARPIFFDAPETCTATAYSRVADNKHHISDVITGSLVGFSVAWAVYRYYNGEKSQKVGSPQHETPFKVAINTQGDRSGFNLSISLLF
jgi:hypothetical protein